MLRAGFARITITPPVGTALQGYFNTRLSDGILDDLHAHVLVLDDGSERIALVTCDLIGVSAEVTARVRELVASDLPPDAVMVSATHTHTGPSVVDSKITPVCPDWVALLPKLIAGGIRAAIVDLQPAELAFATGRDDTLTFNRRYLMKDGTVRTNPGIGNPDVVEAVGPIDPDVHVLFVRSAETAQPLGLLVNFTCHTDTTGGTRISADYPAHLSRVLRRVLGEECVVLFGNGACGDINQHDVLNPKRKRRVPDAVRVGVALAGDVLRLVGGMETFTSEVRLGWARQEIVVPYRHVTEEEIAEARRVLADEATPGVSTSRPERLHANKILAVAEKEEPGRSTEVQSLTIGETAIVGVPCELFVELGLEIKARSPAERTLVIELANDAIGYMPTEKAFSEGGYEVSVSHYAPEAPRLLVEAALTTLSAARHG